MTGVLTPAVWRPRRRGWGPCCPGGQELRVELLVPGVQAGVHLGHARRLALPGTAVAGRPALPELRVDARVEAETRSVRHVADET